MRLQRLLRKYAYGMAGLPFPAINAWRDHCWRGTGTVGLISFDIDYSWDERAVPEVLEVLERYDARASFAVIGAHVRARPHVYRQIVKHDHEIVNHTENHPDNKEICPHLTWTNLSRDQKREEVVRGRDTIEEVLGIHAAGFRLPHFGNLQQEDARWFYEMLASEKVTYSSSMLDYHMNGQGIVQQYGSGVFEIAITTCPRHPYNAMDTYHVMRSNRFAHRWLHRNYELVPSMLEALEHCLRRDVPFNIYLDPADVTMGSLPAILQALRERDIKTATYAEFVALQMGGHQSPS